MQSPNYCYIVFEAVMVDRPTLPGNELNIAVVVDCPTHAWK